MIFENREHAGELLFEALEGDLEGVFPGEIVVVGIVNGGVPVGEVISRKLACTHDVVVIKKLTTTDNKELAYGAIGSDVKSVFLNSGLIDDLLLSKEIVDQEIKKKQVEVLKKEAFFRNNNHEHELRDKVVIIVDDGVATGATAKVAIREIFRKNPLKVIFCTPVISKDSLCMLESEADAVVYLQAPDDFFAVGQWYVDFEHVEDDVVIELLNKR